MPPTKNHPGAEYPAEICVIILTNFLSGDDLVCTNPDPLKDAVNVPATLAKWYDPQAMYHFWESGVRVILVCKAWKDATQRVAAPYIHFVPLSMGRQAIVKAKRIQENLNFLACRYEWKCTCGASVVNGLVCEMLDPWARTLCPPNGPRSTLQAEIAISNEKMGRSKICHAAPNLRVRVQNQRISDLLGKSTIPFQAEVLSVERLDQPIFAQPIGL